MNFIEELKWRGMLHDSTPGVEEHLNEKTRVGYIGFDPTAPALTLGNFVQIMICLLYTSPSPRDATLSRMPSSA